VGHRSGSSFRGRNKHQPSHRDSADGGRRAKKTASGDSKQEERFDRTAERRPINQRTGLNKYIIRTPYIKKKQVSVKLATRSLRSRRALDETEEATAINVESDISVMSG